VCSGLAHRTVRCATGQCPVHQDRTESNKPLSGFSRRTLLKITGLSGVSPDCPVCQRSNDYFAQRSTAKVPDARNSARQSQSVESEAHQTVNSTYLVRHRTVRCAHRQQPSPTATRWLVAINTTPTGHFKVWEPKKHSKSYS
jgi:hypothetical protein